MTDPTSAAELRARAAAVLDAHWTEHGYCVPNPTTYPWQWLWDSCFHALVWAAVDDERAVVELASCLADVDDDGFVPHMRYAPDPDAATSFWGRRATSSITQPPMYGHAVAELVGRGMDVPELVVERATAGLRFLLRRRARSTGGLVRVVHPWETGCDDSPRWDRWRPDPDDVPAWRATKGALLATVERSAGGAPLANPAFDCAPAGFSALVAWNARELADVTGDDALRHAGDELAELVDARWDGRTWVDDGDAAGGSGAIDTLDGLLPALLGGPHAQEAVARLADSASFAAPHGPRGVSAAEACYRSDAYWRGPVWPQLAYLSVLAATRVGSSVVAPSVSTTTRSGAVASGWAEYWDPETGAGLGAVPQSWTGVAALLPD